ncbi:diaminopimelate decarboxylase [Bythopirellula polymerisocia]|uniref:Diaminopimelate decarboxylase n=1 Tax=Bythopirellula polymerisocia TaxID=2528003 RepID=A0A5C6CI87_9BACT|nr:diaminopimelate decarboxylase [Bythopirellula polymerisocia]TWU24523.1 Diaminopimelate decarboxylase [Bythopirellula polymerisocia]
MTTTNFPTRIETLAGQPIPQLAEKFGTPLYVYDAATIEARIREFAAFDVVRFAQKACSNLAILDLMRKAGVLVDAVSAGEIRRALAVGYQPGRGEHPEIVYTADLFDRESLDLVVENNLPVNCGSPEMIDQLGERMPGCGITLRINPGFGHGHSQKTNTGGSGSKHGIWHTQIADCVKRGAKYGITVTGLHMHIGSGTDMQHLSQVCQAMEKTAMEVGPTLRSISAGGGLSVPYREGEQRVDVAAYFELWDATRQKLAIALGTPLTLEIEPGRYLVAESGNLLTEIRAVKQMGENLYYLVDAGFNNLARPILYGSYHPMAICQQNHKSEVLLDVVVGGPLCESGDIFTQEEGGFVSTRQLPEAKVGDLLIIGCAGAYGAVMGSNYNSKPLAAEILVKDSDVHLIRARQTFEDLIRGENIPAGK